MGGNYHFCLKTTDKAVLAKKKTDKAVVESEVKIRGKIKEKRLVYKVWIATLVVFYLNITGICLVRIANSSIRII